MIFRNQKITLGEMRASGVRGVLVYCSDCRCSYSIEVNADAWPDDTRLSDLEDRFVCTVCGQRGADVRPNHDEGKRSVGLLTSVTGAIPHQGACGKFRCLDLTQGHICEKGNIFRFMYEMKLNRKWRWWEWTVSDRSGKIGMFGREFSRPAARYKAERALFQLLLTKSRPCDLEEPKRKTSRS